jgi:hypothetical protein
VLVVVLVVGGGVVVVEVVVEVVVVVVVELDVVVVVDDVVVLLVVVLLVVVEDVVVVGGGVVVVEVVGGVPGPTKRTLPVNTPPEKAPASWIFDPASNGGPELLILSIRTFDLGRFAITVEVPSRLTFEPIPDIPHTQLR